MGFHTHRYPKMKKPPLGENQDASSIPVPAKKVG
jgi:hypothetical protein